MSLSSLQRIDLWDFPHLTELKMKNKDKVCCLDLDGDDGCDIAGYLDHCQQHLNALLSTSTHPAWHLSLIGQSNLDLPSLMHAFTFILPGDLILSVNALNLV